MATIPRISQMQLDFLLAQIDRDFPIKAKPEPADDLASIETIAKSRMPEYYRSDRYSFEVLHWIATDPDTDPDTEAVTAYRVSRSMVSGGLEYSRAFTMAEIGDPQNYVNARGLCLETRNADGDVIGKFFPTRYEVSFI